MTSTYPRQIDHVAHDEFLGHRFYVEDPISYLRSTYVDPEFNILQSSDVILAPENERDFQQAGGNRLRRTRMFQHYAKRWKWKRASEVVSGVSCEIPDELSPRDFIQGAVGNCGFCSGFSSLAASRPDFITKAIHYDSTIGAFSIRLYPRGRKRYLLLDDYIVVSNRMNDNDCSSPSLHGRFPGADLLVRFLEKVFVKLQGSYASLDGYYKYQSLYRHPARALQLLTGARHAIELHATSTGTGPTVPLCRRLFAVLRSTEGKYSRVAHCRKTILGLHSNHGYSLLWVGSILENESSRRHLQLACLRNPHGRCSFTGKFGFGSAAWTDLVKQSLLRRHGDIFTTKDGRITWTSGNASDPVDDGIFFMEFSLFVECFPQLTLVGPHSHDVTPLEIPDCIHRVFLR